MKSNFIITDSVRLKLGALLKRISIFLLSCIVAFTSPLCVHASEPTATPGGSGSGEYVTIQVPLTWSIDRHLNLETGQEYSAESGSVSGPINIIPGASYSVSIGPPGNSSTTGVMAFYYQDLNFLNFQELWTMSTGSKTVSLVVPGVATNFRLTTDTIATSNNSQNNINLSITLSATYLEEQNLTEEAVLDLVYRDDSTVIDDATQKTEEALDLLSEQEYYLMEESNSVFSDFFGTFGFEDLVEYSAGFTFIGTWFSNFYNSHSALALMIGTASGLTILFILLRFKGY